MNSINLFCYGVLGIILTGPLLSTSAQYFGKNTVQYQSFDFRYMETGHFKVYFYPEEQNATQDAARMLERWHARQALIFNVTLKNQPIILYAQHSDFQQTNVIGGIIPQGVGGVTEGIMNRIVLPLTGVYADNDHVIGHELVHAFQYHIQNVAGGGVAQGTQLPLWFVEGMAEYLSLGSFSPLTAMWMRDAVLHDDVPDFNTIANNPDYFPYRYGHALWAFLAGKYGDHVVGRLFRETMRKGWNRGFEAITGKKMSQLSTEWQAMIRENFKPHLDYRSKPIETGHVLIDDQGDIHLTPVISPDGTMIAYISARDPLIIDLYIANVKSGKTLKRLTRSLTDKHFDALRFYNSAGTWSPDGHSFAATVLRQGHTEIAIVDIAEMSIQQTIQIENMKDIMHLSWSPDGKTIAIAGTQGGISDLFLYNLQNKHLEQLTNDRYADIHPSWSPDGSTIVFATDRGPLTDFDNLVYGPMRIGFLSLSDRSIHTIALDDHVKHINPCYSPGGKQVFFIADPDGINDLYSYDIPSGTFSRHTRIATGITGLTDNSAAMSMALDTGIVAFSVFDKRGYKINTMSITSMSTFPVPLDQNTYRTTIHLSPEYPSNMIVDTYLENAFLGLPPADTAFSIADYKPRLRLAFLGQLFAGVTVNESGAGVGGGVSLVFSDLLGDHLLGAAAQISGGLNTTGGELVYYNRKGRLNWGIGLNRFPYVTSQATSETDSIEIDGETVRGEQYVIELQRITSHRGFLFAEYPFSLNRRLEVALSFNRLDYAKKAEVISVIGNAIIDRENVSIDAPSPLNLFQSSVSYVGDFSFNGMTGPIAGRRFRYELSPTTGSLQYVSVLFDYRQYFYFRPVTWALRGYHLGRYFGDSESSQLSTFFLGIPSWVRGYEVSTFDADECTDNGANCPVLDRLIGSRVFVANAELRLSVFSVERLGLVTFPMIPLDIVGFIDAGMAWTNTNLPEVQFSSSSSDRIPVFSIGAATRVNIIGLLVAQIYYAYPFQRPRKGAHFGFLLAPGW